MTTDQSRWRAGSDEEKRAEYERAVAEFRCTGRLPSYVSPARGRGLSRQARWEQGKRAGDPDWAAQERARQKAKARGRRAEVKADRVRDLESKAWGEAITDREWLVKSFTATCAWQHTGTSCGCADVVRW